MRIEQIQDDGKFKCLLKLTLTLCRDFRISGVWWVCSILKLSDFSLWKFGVFTWLKWMSLFQKTLSCLICKWRTFLYTRLNQTLLVERVSDVKRSEEFRGKWKGINFQFWLDPFLSRMCACHSFCKKFVQAFLCVFSSLISSFFAHWKQFLIKVSIGLDCVLIFSLAHTPHSSFCGFFQVSNEFDTLWESWWK